MGFSRNILPGIGRNGDLPSGGWKIRFGKHPDLTDKSGTISWDNTKVVPLIWSGNWGISGSWRENSPTTTSLRAFGKTIGYVAITPMTSYSVGQYNIYSSNASWNMIEIYGGIETVMAMNSITSDIKLTCTVWLEKNRGGSLYCKLFKNPFVKGFSALRQSGKRWNLMGFCRNILPGNAGGNPFPGYKLKTGVLCSLPQVTQSNIARRSLSIPANCIPICIKCSGTWNCYSGKGETSNLGMSITDNNGRAFVNVNKNSGPQWMSLNTPFYLNPLGAYNDDLEAASTINRIDINTWGNGGMYDATTGKLEVTAWLEKIGSGGSKPVVPKQYKRLYLYKDGDQCTDVTGGWTFTKPASTASGYSSSLNKDGEMYCGGQNSGNGIFSTVNPINMSDYDRLMVEFHYDGNAGDGNASFFVMAGGTEMIKINISTIAKNKICLAGTSELAGGNVQLKVNTGGYSTTHMYIKRVWLETVGE